jgi:hypothetical protein
MPLWPRYRKAVLVAAFGRHSFIALGSSGQDGTGIRHGSHAPLPRVDCALLSTLDTVGSATGADPSQEALVTSRHHTHNHGAPSRAMPRSDKRKRIALIARGVRHISHFCDPR